MQWICTVGIGPAAVGVQAHRLGKPAINWHPILKDPIAVLKPKQGYLKYLYRFLFGKTVGDDRNGFLLQALLSNAIQWLTTRDSNLDDNVNLHAIFCCHLLVLLTGGCGPRRATACRHAGSI